MNRSILAIMPYVLLLVGSIIFAYFGWDFYTKANHTIREVEIRMSTFELNEEILSDGIVFTRELQDIQSRVEASEQRALGYLGIFEALGIVLTVVGLILPVIFSIAGNAIVSINRNLISDFDLSLEKIDEAQKQADENQRKAADFLDTLRQSREDIILELENRLRNDVGKSNLALSLLPLAERQYQSGNVDGALDTYQRAIDLDPNNPVPHYYVGYILTQKNYLKDAEIALRKALALDERFLHAQAALGYTLRRIGEHEENFEARYKIYGEAEKLLKMALAANAQLVDADGESWYGSLAGLYKRLGDVEQAKFYYERAAIVTPLSSYPVLNLAVIALEHHSEEINIRFERVERLALLKILSIQENYWSYGDLLMARLALGKSEEALDTLDTLIEIVPVGVKDVLPRVKSSIELLQVTSDYPDDRRNPETIVQVLERLTLEIDAV